MKVKNKDACLKLSLVPGPNHDSFLLFCLHPSGPHQALPEIFLCSKQSLGRVKPTDTAGHCVTSVLTADV